MPGRRPQRATPRSPVPAPDPRPMARGPSAPGPRTDRPRSGPTPNKHHTSLCIGGDLIAGAMAENRPALYGRARGGDTAGEIKGFFLFF